MKNFYIHLLVALILSQIYVNFAFERIHYLVAVLVICTIGIINGFIYSFKSEDHILPDLSSNHNDTHTNYLLSYKFYSNLTYYLSNCYHYSNTNSMFERFTSLDDRLHNSSTGNNLNNKNEFELDDGDDGDELDDEIEFDSYSVSSRLGTNDMNYHHEEEIETESNSKIDMYLEEIINLIVRDFVIVFLGDFAWEKEKFFALVK